MLDASLTKKIYQKEVTVNGDPLFNYNEPSMQGDWFAWGYVGGGPHALTISILCDYFGVQASNERPQAWINGVKQKWFFYYQAFLNEHVSQWPQMEDFSITSDEITDWIALKNPYDGSRWSTASP